MLKPPKIDPYAGFKDDRERRLALNTQVRSKAIAVVAIALAGAPIDWAGKIQWLTYLFR